MKRTYVVGFLALLAPAAACDLDLHGFSEGSPDGGLDVASPAVLPPAPSDEADAGTEAGPDAEVPPPCPSLDPSVILCEDFERGGPPPDNGWGEPSVTGDLSYQGGVGQRGSRALHARENETGNTDYSTSSAMGRDLSMNFASGQQFTINVQFKLVATTNAESVTLLLLTTPDADYSVALYKSLECPGGDGCFAGGDFYAPGSVNYGKAVRADIDVWHAIQLIVVRTNDGTALTLKIDGKTIDENRAIDSITNESTLRLYLGALFGRKMTEVVFDDLVVRRAN